MAEVSRDEAEIHAVFEQMGRVGMPERVGVRPLVHTALLARPAEGRLQARAGDGAGAGWDDGARAAADRRGELGRPHESRRIERGRRSAAHELPRADSMPRKSGLAQDSARVYT